ELPAWTETSNTCTTKTAGHDVPKERKLAAEDHTGGRVLANWRWFRPAVPPGCVPIVNDVTPPVDPLNVMMRPPPFAPVDRPDAGMVVPSTGRPKNRGSSDGSCGSPRTGSGPGTRSCHPTPPHTRPHPGTGTSKRTPGRHPQQ